MKSLRFLDLSYCFLRAVPAFVVELESLEILDLIFNNVQIFATLDFLIEGYPRLREVRLDRPYTPESRAYLQAFKARLLTQNPNAKVCIY